MIASSWTYLFVAAAVLAAVWWLLHRVGPPDPARRASDRARADASDPFKEWVQSVIAIVTRDCDYAYIDRAEARRILAEWWDVQGPIEFRRTLDELGHAGRPDNAWDLVRFMVVARLGVAAGHWHDDEAWGAIRPIALRLQRAYPGWSAMAQAYVHARRQWRRLALDGSEDDDTMRWITDNVARLRDERWSRLAFDLDFEGGRKDVR